MKSEKELLSMSIEQLRKYHAEVDEHEKQIWILIRYKQRWNKV